MRVIEDAGNRVVSVVWPGVRCLGPDSWAAATRNPAERGRLMHELAAGTWNLVEFAWMATTRVVIRESGHYYSTFVCFDEGNNFIGWYVNFELPFFRTPIGVDTRDLALDLVVGPDGTWQWKDEDEFAYMQRAGEISKETVLQVERAREEVLEQVRGGSGPFAEGWALWKRDPSWPLPVVPDVVETIPFAHVSDGTVPSDEGK